jgi:hypothetical protein
MVPVEDTRRFSAETQAICWVTAVEARQLIRLNHKPKRRRCDLRVLKLALAFFQSVGPAPGLKRMDD